MCGFTFSTCCVSYEIRLSTDTAASSGCLRDSNQLRRDGRKHKRAGPLGAAGATREDIGERHFKIAMRTEVNERADTEAIELQMSEPALVQFPTHGAECAMDAQRAASVHSACPECERTVGHSLDCVLRPVYHTADWLADRYARGDIAVYRIAGVFVRIDEPLEPHQ